MTEDGELYLAMEYIDGPRMSDVLKDGPLPADRALVNRLGFPNEGAAKGRVPADMATRSASGLDPHISPANAALQTHGGFGFACEYDVERKFRETRLYQVAPISTNLIYSYVAEHLLGLPRSF